jgi:heme exporter protein A
MSAPPGLHLQAQALTLARGSRVLFRGLSFELRAGQILFLTGPNGSGKSSLLRALIGLAPLQSGRLSWSSGQTEATPIAPASLRKDSLVQGHAAGVKAELTALENLRLCAGLDRGPDGQPADDAALAGALDQVGLRPQRDIETRRLSQGQKQRLQLARFALAVTSAHRPLWLMDEPSAALDTQGSALLQELLGRHLSRGGAALVATHLPLAVRAGQTGTLPLGPVAEPSGAEAWTH